MNLVQRVAELFSKPPWRCVRDHPMQISSLGKCVDINCPHRYKGSVPDDCPVPSVIDITDLGKALECFRGRYHSKRGVKDAIVKIHPYHKYNIGWVCVEATPAQIWEICVLAKESE